MVRPATLPALEMRCGHAPVLNREFPNGLEHFQAFVDGLIDVINIDSALIAALDRMYGVSFGRRACIVVADEMYPESMPLNEVASALAGQPVFGDALFVDLP